MLSLYNRPSFLTSCHNLRPFGSAAYTSLFIALLIFSTHSWAALIPKHLSRSDRQEVVRTLGFGTSTKLLTNPYPLGGYTGLELGLSMEFVDTRELGRLGCDPNQVGCPNQERVIHPELRYPRFSIGKGLYNNIDIFFHFIPPGSGVDKVTDYGGALRWSFYEAKFLPINLSLLVHMSQINVGDSFVNFTTGTELIAGIYIDNFSLYFGGGQLKANGRFMGGTGSQSVIAPDDPHIDPSSNTVTETLKQAHVLVGVSFHHKNLFAALQVDRYREPVYGAKLGLRF